MLAPRVRASRSRFVPLAFGAAALALAALFAASDAMRNGDGDHDGDGGGEEREEGPKNPGGVVQRAQARRSADGTVPHDAVMTAFAQKQQMALTDSATNVQWTWLGPGNAGGRIRAVLIHPTNPSRIWVGTAGGGVWRSDDGGTSWMATNGGLPMLGCGCMALDPSNPDHLWFGSGEGFFDAPDGSSNTAILRGAGLFESVDAGLTWTRIASTATPDWYFVNRLAVSPQSAQTLLAATASGIWRSTDAGQTWSRRTTTRTFDLDFHPTDGLQAVAGRADGTAAWSSDGGLTWTAANGIANSTRIEIAYARSTPLTVYVTASNITGQISVWRSLNGGQTYTLRSSAVIQTYSLYNNCLWVDPTNANNLLYGGVQLFRSLDGGASRTQSTTGAHADYHVIVEHPQFDGTTNRRVYVGDDGGLHTRADFSTGTWQALNAGLGITQLYGAAMNPTTSVMVAGAQDNGTSRFTGNPLVWNYNVIGGDGGFCAADQTNPNYFYGGYQYLGLQRSGNGGANWTDIRGATTSDAGFNFIPYFMLDPNDQNRMLACGRSLWRANDVRTGSPPTWTQIKQGRACVTFAGGPANAHFADNPPCNHSTVQVAAGNPDVIWVGHNDGELWRTANGTAGSPTWTLVDGPTGGLLPDRWVSSIAIDPADHAHVLVSFMGYTADNLWETRNAGTTWQLVVGTGTGALPAIPVSWVVMHPRVATQLFAATDLGVFCSSDAGGSWAPLQGGPENVCTDQLVWKNDRDLLCVTHGQGVWMATLAAATATPVGAGCATGVPPLLTSSPPALGGTATFALAGGRAATLLVFGLSIGPPAGAAHGPCTLQVDVATMTTLAGTTDANGAWSFPLAIPSWPWLLGVEATTQAFVFGLGGPMLAAGDLSNGVLLTLGF